MRYAAGRAEASENAFVEVLCFVDQDVVNSCLRLRERPELQVAIVTERQQGDWSVLRFPAIAEEAEVHHYRTFLGEQTFTRQAGEALHPERESMEVLQQMKAVLGEYNFAGQYEQRPAPNGGGIVKLQWFRTYLPSDSPAKFDQLVQSWDTATSPSETADYSVCTTWGIHQKNVYLLDVHRE